MNRSEMAVRYPETYDEIKPLVDLCKAGRLFEVQEWVRAGKPVNLPLIREKRIRRKSPLEIAMEAGFYSLVQVLLEGGAEVEAPDYSSLQHALWKRRLDLVQLLVNHGDSIHSVGMESVFETWDPKIMEYFIEQGADVETDHPLAWALCSKIRTALNIFQRYKDRFPSFQKQANIALRHHCKEGSLKWVSLLLWAGADPLEKGPSEPCEDPDPEEDNTALELAALFGHYDIFKLKRIQLDPKHPRAKELLEDACHSGKGDLLKELLGRGFSPKDFEDEGSSLIQSLLNDMCWSFSFDLDFFSYRNRPRKNIDTSKSQEKIRMIHMLARHGAKWRPRDETDINNARRSLLKMIPDYTMEFIWIMSGYNACTREAVEQLIRTACMHTLLSNQTHRVTELIEDLHSVVPL
jgi:hypothetical protein